MANPPAGLSGTNVQAADKAAHDNNALWYTFTGIGRAYLVRRGSAAAIDADVSSVHGYSTIEQAYSNPNSNNAATQTTITQWNYYASLPAGGGTLGLVETVNITAPTKPGQQPQVSTPQNPTTAAAKQSLSYTLGASGIAAWFARGLKVVFGGILIIAGILKLTNTDKTLNQVLPLVGGPAGKVLKV